MLNTTKYLTFNSPEVIKYLEESPYDIMRKDLYTSNDLYDKLDPENPESLDQCYDFRVYQHYLDKGELSTDPLEIWARNSHDAAIFESLQIFLEPYKEKNLVIGIMGGHAILRDQENYKKIVLLAKVLTEQGFLIATGGGPGAMEAAHLGAWMAGRSLDDVDEALKILVQAPSFTSRQWYSTAYQVVKKFPRNKDMQSISIPTWLYGHEPPALFASSIAKMFSNCHREDILTNITTRGRIFMPGSAGTMQEIFQAVEKDHYLADVYPTPMIFVGKEHWRKNCPVYPVVNDMLKSRNLRNLLAYLIDDVEDVIDIINDYSHLAKMIMANKEKQ